MYDPIARAREVGKWAGPVDFDKRYQYPLGPDSVVFDLGGYDGEWAAVIHQRYGCRVFSFEPLPGHTDRCRHRLAGLPSVEVFPFGLGNFDHGEQWILLTSEGDASSMFRTGLRFTEAPLVSGRLRGWREFLQEHPVSEIDLLKMNIEGAEFDLLDYLTRSGLIHRVRFLQVQFHEFMDDAVARREAIHAALCLTHKLDWDYPWIFESWSRQ